MGLCFKIYVMIFNKGRPIGTHNLFPKCHLQLIFPHNRRTGIINGSAINSMLEAQTGEFADIYSHCFLIAECYSMRFCDGYLIPSNLFAPESI